MAFAVSAQSQGTDKRDIRKGIKGCTCSLFSSFVGSKSLNSKKLFTDSAILSSRDALTLFTERSKTIESNCSLSLSYPQNYESIRAPPFS
ncbi:MAG: hypothetical protein KAG61_06740 [Bacteriovoracaceae bacterium]|nr:hypothetical protein [Bacteriovoracaceae bacterium]